MNTAHTTDPKHLRTLTEEELADLIDSRAYAGTAQEDALFAERERRIAELQAANRRVEQTAEAWLAMPKGLTEGQEAARYTMCPFCGAMQGRPCRGKNGERISKGRRSHPERVRLARKLVHEADLPD